MFTTPFQITQILVLLFLIITFLISGFEKVIDWNGSVVFIKEHFELSPLKNFVPLLLLVLVILDFIASFFMIFGIYNIVSINNTSFALIGIQLSAVSILCMLIGQRFAKDYQGATSLGVYFLICLFGMFFLK